MLNIPEIIKSEIPIAFFKEMKSVLDQAYEEAVIISKSHFSTPEASNMLPHLFNGKVESHLREIASKYSCFDVETVKLENGYYHNIIRTDSIVITQKSIQSIGSMIEPSLRKKSLAQGNAILLNNYQPPLFAIDPMQGEGVNNRLYGILTHNRASVYEKNESLFLNLAFPDPEFNEYITNFDIIDYCNSTRFINVVATPIVEIQDETDPKLKITLDEVKAQ